LTDEQFGRLAEMIRRLLTLQEQHCSALGEANYYLRQLSTGASPPGAGTPLADDEEEGRAQFYVVRRKQDGELGLMFYAAAPLVQQPTGKLYYENFGLLAPHCQVNLDEPVWAGKDSPSRAILEQLPGYLRPLGGTLHFVKKERPARNGGFASKPIVRVLSFTKDAEADPRSKAETPAVSTQQPEQPPGHRSAPPTVESAPTETERRLRQTIGAALGLTGEADITRAGDYLAARWTGMQHPPLPADNPIGTALKDLSPEQMERLRQHLLTHANRWRATWRTAQPATSRKA